MAREAVIVAAKRTPVGKNEGQFKDVRADELGAAAVKAVLQETRLDPALVDDVVFGCVTQVKDQGLNVARGIALLAGLPVEVPAQTVNRFCGSGLQAINQAAQAILAGDADVVIAGGVENMTHVPMGAGEPEPHPDLAAKWPHFVMGFIGEQHAQDFKFSREELDRFSYESHMKAVRAIKEGWLKAQIAPVEVPGPDGTKRLVEVDETPRPNTSVEKMATLMPSFRPDGKLTAGNSSPITDGAAAVLLMSADKARSLKLKPMACYRGGVAVGVHPGSLLGPIPAIRKLVKRLNKSVQDFDIIEVNEAFSSVALACMKELEIRPERYNPNGGAIALGHPLGASGARITTTLLHELIRRKGRWGIASLCIGYGQGIATAYEVAQ